MSGDIVRDLPNNDYTWTGTAITTVTFRRARRSEFDASVRNSGEAASELAQNIDTQLQRARDLMTSSQKVTVRAKAAAFLLWAHKTLSTSAVPDDGRFDFPFTLEDVSALVGVTRPRLSRNLKQLSREGVIQYTTAGKDRRSSFRVLDVERLKAIANE
ncbi:Crp/Fnr family transcriptional regulator [Candidatus Kaiserbacteria bacterium]|nr:Crp/Fnr family transcriptional regulator [Candidatus Kaiserbacteria bacterium]